MAKPTLDINTADIVDGGIVFADTQKARYDELSTFANDLADWCDTNFIVASKTDPQTMAGNLDMGGQKVVGLATPSADNDAARKKYVDDEITAATKDFGSLTTEDTTPEDFAVDEVYKTECDGFVIIQASAGGSQGNSIQLLIGLTDNPTDVVTSSGYFAAGTHDSMGLCVPVAKDEYWKFTRKWTNITYTIRWRPIGAGGCVKQ